MKVFTFSLHVKTFFNSKEKFKTLERLFFVLPIFFYFAAKIKCKQHFSKRKFRCNKNYISILQKIINYLMKIKHNGEKCSVVM